VQHYGLADRKYLIYSHTIQFPLNRPYIVNSCQNNLGDDYLEFSDKINSKESSLRKKLGKGYWNGAAPSFLVFRGVPLYLINEIASLLIQ
jgi:hypothetical protein